MRSSSFKWNTADRDSGGVANMAMYSTAVVEGDDNVFDGNECFGVGAVFSASVNTSITIEGGLFINNNVNQVGPEAFYFTSTKRFGAHKYKPINNPLMNRSRNGLQTMPDKQSSGGPHI